MKFKQGLISAVIPTRHRPKRLRKCIDSLLNQTYKNVEVIVAHDRDDHLPQYQDEARVKHIFLEDSNQSKARNAGHELAKGGFLLPADDDMTFRPFCLEVAIEALNDNPQASYAYWRYRVRLDTLWELSIICEFNADRLRQLNYVPMGSLVRNEPELKFDTKLSRFIDWDFWLTLLDRGKRGVAIDRVLASKDDLDPSSITKTESGRKASAYVRAKHGNWRRTGRPNLNTKEFWEKQYAPERRPINRLQEYRFQATSELIPDGSRILEVGCGCGDLPQFMTEQGKRFSYLGIDFSGEAVKKARQRRIPGSKFLPCDFRDALVVGHFDRVVAIELLEHLERPEDFLQWSMLRLKEGGSCICSVPFQDTLSLPEHILVFSEGEFKALMGKFGELRNFRFIPGDHMIVEVKKSG